MPDDKDQRTEKATPRHREEQRKKGRVASSRDINSAAVMLFGVILMYVTAGSAYKGLTLVMNTAFGDAIVRDWSNASLLAHMGDVTVQTVKAFGPLFLGIGIVAAAAAYGQAGFFFSTDPLTPKFERLNPIAGLGRLFSFKSLFRLFTSVGKVLIVGATIYLYLRSKVDELPLLTEMTTLNLLVYIGRSMFMVTLITALVLMILAAIDYAHQRYQHEKDLRMTPQQIREELKRAEGDPLVKARIRQIQRDTARQRMMEDVPEADVIVKNPTHYAVALKYDAKGMKAPKVIAKGMNLIALKIIDIAQQNNVPVVENKPLARALHKTVEIGDEIPMSLYKAVAEVLAYVYELRRGRRRA